MVTKSYLEKRVFERMPCFLAGTYVLPDEQTGPMVSHDISALGAKVSALSPLPLHSLMEFNFKTKNNIPFSRLGEVRWVKKGKTAWQAGISFERALFSPRELIA